MKFKLIIFLFLAIGTQAQAQNYSSIWKPVTGAVMTTDKMALQPSSFLTFSASEMTLKSLAANASHDPLVPSAIDLPQPDGTYRTFNIWKNDLLPEALSNKYPGIYTLTGEAVDNRSVTAKIELTPFGFHAYVFDGSQSYLIDPYAATADGYYIVYYRNSYLRANGSTMACVLNTEPMLPKNRVDMTPDGLPIMQRLNGTIKKSYRLALAADSEYCYAVAGPSPTKAAVLAKMVVTMNRVNGVYEREFAISMTLVPNDDTLIYLSNDPYTNNSGPTMLGENQGAVTTRIGTANYDIGHVFSTGGGGIASLGSVCKANYKAQGVTGSASPVGDAFDIDYVAHEMGHQYGASHTFNVNTTGSCSGNAVSAHAYEPASGSTIMAYAGICTPNDYQQHSDAYFHSTSMEEITTYVGSINGGLGRALTTPSTNTNAIVPSFTASYNIPYKTPFELTAPTATDATADTVTYCWEERNLGDFSKSLSTTFLSGPIFRSFSPTSSPTRVFPSLLKLVSNVTSYNAEKLPDTARYLTFKLVERDIYQGYGAFNFPDDSIHLNVINTGRPFAVTAPNTQNITWIGGSSQTVTWDNAGTTAAPVSAANVDIFLSVDGGYTYPYTLKSGTANDGSETVTVPNINATLARIKVKAAGNVFFDLSNYNFAITKNTTAVSGVSVNPLVQIAPNPAYSLISVSSENVTNRINAHLVNAFGQQVWAGVIQGKETIDISRFARGVYYFECIDITSGTHSTQPLVIQ